MALVVALAGCAEPSGSDPVASSAPGSAGSSIGAVQVTPCTAGRPQRSTRYDFNRDWQTRDLLVGVDAGDYVGGTAAFTGADFVEVGQLLGSGFMDPYERQNAAPSTWAIFQFLCRHPEVTAAGYVVSPERTDYRTSLEGVYSASIDPGLERDARVLCRHASLKTFRGHVDCFWD